MLQSDRYVLNDTKLCIQSDTHTERFVSIVPFIIRPHLVRKSNAISPFLCVLVTRTSLDCFWHHLFLFKFSFLSPTPPSPSPHWLLNLSPSVRGRRCRLHSVNCHTRPSLSVIFLSFFPFITFLLKYWFSFSSSKHRRFRFPCAFQSEHILAPLSFQFNLVLKTFYRLVSIKRLFLSILCQL